jgi:hypothetical protein
MLRSFGKKFVVALALAASGCQSTGHYYDIFDDCFTGCHDHMEAKFAWHQVKSCFYEVENYCDFRDGFIAGYIHVMNGGGCCRPTLPPRKYWSLCTRGPDNNCRVVAWYNGWDSGVAQAQRDGMGSGSIVTAAEIYHTNNPYPIELPPDLRRTSADGETLPAGQPLQPEGEGLLPPGGELAPIPQDFTPPAEQYNPPANPAAATEAVMRIQRVDGTATAEETLTPPVPPRLEVPVQ